MYKYIFTLSLNAGEKELANVHLMKIIQVIQAL